MCFHEVISWQCCAESCQLWPKWSDCCRSVNQVKGCSQTKSWDCHAAHHSSAGQLEFKKSVVIHCWVLLLSLEKLARIYINSAVNDKSCMLPFALGNVASGENFPHRDRLGRQRLTESFSLTDDLIAGTTGVKSVESLILKTPGRGSTPWLAVKADCWLRWVTVTGRSRAAGRLSSAVARLRIRRLSVKVLNTQRLAARPEWQV